jgi:hypothetical protein
VNNVSKKTMTRAMRIGLAAVSALLALQVTTGKAFASVEIFTVDSLTRQGTSQITVSGTVQFSAGDLYPAVGGSLFQFQRGQVGTGAYNGVVLGYQSDGTLQPWSLTFINAFGYKPGPANLAVTAEFFDPSTKQYIRQTLSRRVILPH